jgi:cytochrome c-type biogenesis protein CcmH
MNSPRKNLRRLAWIALLAVGLAFFTARSAAAQQPTPSDDQVNAIARQLFCPVCQNTPLDVCPTEACRQWRELIRQMLAEGKSSDTIKQYFVDNYGARVLPVPPQSGFNWLAYVVPPAAFVAGAFLLFLAYRAWRQGARAAAAAETQPAGSDAAPGSDEYVARLEDELRKRN